MPYKKAGGAEDHAIAHTYALDLEKMGEVKGEVVDGISQRSVSLTHVCNVASAASLVSVQTRNSEALYSI